MVLRSSAFHVYVCCVRVAGVLNLSGSSPCRWYINEDILDVNRTVQGTRNRTAIFLDLFAFKVFYPFLLLPVGLEGSSLL